MASDIFFSRALSRLKLKVLSRYFNLQVPMMPQCSEHRNENEGKISKQKWMRHQSCVAKSDSEPKHILGLCLQTQVLEVAFCSKIPNFIHEGSWCNFPGSSGRQPEFRILPVARPPKANLLSVSDSNWFLEPLACIGR